MPEWVVDSGVRGKGGEGGVCGSGGGGNQVVGATARNVILGKLESRAWEEVVRVVLRCAVVVDQIRQTARRKCVRVSQLTVRASGGYLDSLLWPTLPLSQAFCVWGGQRCRIETESRMGSSSKSYGMI